MDTRKNALLLLSKVPEAGKVKTRLTLLKHGFFDPEVASALYHCMLFDVTECCCDALRDLERADDERRALESTCEYQPLRDTYTLFISSPGIEQEGRCARSSRKAAPGHATSSSFVIDGESFDAHYNNAFNQVWDLGYETILSMGCDMPALRRSIMIEGFERLHELCDRPGGGIVLAPDQEMGVRWWDGRVKRPSTTRESSTMPTV